MEILAVGRLLVVDKDEGTRVTAHERGSGWSNEKRGMRPDFQSVTWLGWEQQKARAMGPSSEAHGDGNTESRSCKHER